MFRKWDNLDPKGRITVIALAVLVLGVLFWIPVSRQVIIYILPLGSGCDDFIFIAGVTFGGTLLAMRLLLGNKIN